MKKIMKRLAKDKRGFTLIELIVVLAILGVMAAVLVPTMSGIINNAEQDVSEANARTGYTAVQYLLASGTAATAINDTTIKGALGDAEYAGTFTYNSTTGVVTYTPTDTTKSAGSYGS